MNFSPFYVHDLNEIVESVKEVKGEGKRSKKKNIYISFVPVIR